MLLLLASAIPKESTSVTAPAIIRISPTVSMSMPETSKFVA